MFSFIGKRNSATTELTSLKLNLTLIDTRLIFLIKILLVSILSFSKVLHVVSMINSYHLNKISLITMTNSYFPVLTITK